MYVRLLIIVTDVSASTSQRNDEKHSMFNSFTYLGFLAFSVPIGIIIGLCCIWKSCRRRRGDHYLKESDYPEPSESEGFRYAAST